MIKPTRLAAESAVGEFAGADLGDARLERRLMLMVERLAPEPDASLPVGLGTGAELEAGYRFLRNSAVTAEALLKPHIDATVRRISQHREVLAVHDSTEFRFNGSRTDLGDLGRSGHGFLGHFTLAVAQDARRDALGVLALETWARTGPTPTALRRAKKLTVREALEVPNEQDRWLRGVEAAEQQLGTASSLLHVMDSEADDYDLMGALVAAQRRFVIRLCYDRVLATASKGEKTKEMIAQREVICTKTVHLSRRGRRPGGVQRKRSVPRPERLATLAVSAGPATFRRPNNFPAGPRTLPVNIVAVREINAPSDQEPVEWLLITTEPIASEEQVLKVIDCYRARWRIEEYFKALKTGCAIEKRQLESMHTLRNGLALFIPIAWTLLRLRAASRLPESVPASEILEPDEITVLRKLAEKPLPPAPSATEAMLAIARLGGHLRSNGDPGWLVLGRGYEKLLATVAGYRLALQDQKK
jgi:hypothetical protein